MFLAVKESRRRLGVHLRPPAARRLLLLLASVTLLGTGSLDVAYRAGAAPATQWATPAAAGTVVGRPDGSPVGAERQAPHGVPVVRAASAAALPGPLASSAGPPPGRTRLAAPQLTAAPRSRTPTTAPDTAFSGPPGSRAPPAAAGTDASLPRRT